MLSFSSITFLTHLIDNNEWTVPLLVLFSPQINKQIQLIPNYPYTLDYLVQIFLLKKASSKRHITYLFEVLTRENCVVCFLIHILSIPVSEVIGLISSTNYYSLYFLSFFLSLWVLRICMDLFGENILHFVWTNWNYVKRFGGKNGTTKGLGSR